MHEVLIPGLYANKWTSLELVAEFSLRCQKFVKWLSETALEGSVGIYFTLVLNAFLRTAIKIDKKSSITYFRLI